MKELKKGIIKDRSLYETLDHFNGLRIKEDSIDVPGDVPDGAVLYYPWVEQNMVWHPDTAQFKIGPLLTRAKFYPVFERIR